MHLSINLGFEPAYSRSAAKKIIKTPFIYLNVIFGIRTQINLPLKTYFLELLNKMSFLVSHVLPLYLQ